MRIDLDSQSQVLTTLSAATARARDKVNETHGGMFDFFSGNDGAGERNLLVEVDDLLATMRRLGADAAAFDNRGAKWRELAELARDDLSHVLTETESSSVSGILKATARATVEDVRETTAAAVGLVTALVPWWGYALAGVVLVGGVALLARRVAP